MNKNKNVDDYKKELFGHDRLVEREKIFSTMTLKSLNNIYQKSLQDENVSFLVFVLASELLPKENRDYLDALLSEYPFLKIQYHSQDIKDINQHFLEYYINNINNGDIYASVRMDDDDLLSVDWYTKIVHEFMKVHYNGHIISLSSGLAMLINSDMSIEEIAKFKWRLIALGLVYVGVKTDDNRSNINIYQTGDHMRVDEKYNTIILSDTLYWIRVYNQSNDSGHTFSFKDKWNIDHKVLNENFGLDICYQVK